MTKGVPRHMNYGLEIRNIATSKCLLVHALTHPAEKNAQPTGMNLYETTACRHQGARPWLLTTPHPRTYGLKK
jgi:hypothetical protein